MTIRKRRQTGTSILRADARVSVSMRDRRCTRRSHQPESGREDPSLAAISVPSSALPLLSSAITFIHGVDEMTYLSALELDSGYFAAC